MPFSARHLDQEPSRVEVDALPGLTLLEFGAPWCPHCIAVQPLLESALGAHANIRHLKIEDGRGKPLGRSFRIKLWPTLILMRDGIELMRAVRPTTAAEIAVLFASLTTIDPSTSSSANTV